MSDEATDDLELQPNGEAIHEVVEPKDDGLATPVAGQESKATAIRPVQPVRRVVMPIRASESSVVPDPIGEPPAYDEAIWLKEVFWPNFALCMTVIVVLLMGWLLWGIFWAFLNLVTFVVVAFGLAFKMTRSERR